MYLDLSEATGFTSMRGSKSRGNPLFCHCCTCQSIKKILKLSMGTAMLLAICVLIITSIYTEPIVAIFNSEQNKMMALYAFTGVKIYFVGFLFAGCDIVGAGYLSATEKASLSFGISMMRGVVAIIICAVVLAYFLGMTGVWLAFPVAEGLTFVLMWIAVGYEDKWH